MPNGVSQQTKRSLDEWMVEPKEVEQKEEQQQEKKDGEMLTDGKLFLYPVFLRWRRLALKAVKSYENIRLTQLLEMVTSRSSKPALETDCTHPLYARYRSGNDYGKYVHCRACKERLSYICPWVFWGWAAKSD